MTQASLAEFAAAHADGAAVIDVREPGEYVQGHVPGAELVPMARIPNRARGLATGEPVYVICASGNRSDAMTDVLRRAGVDARSVVGGTSAWVASGRPVVTGPRAASA